MFRMKTLIVAAGLSVLTLSPCATSQSEEVAGKVAEKIYRQAPRDINMEGKYRTLARLCFGGRMAEAEQKAAAVLDLGYTGTRFECWVWNKIAAGYERLGDAAKAIEFYQRAMDASDPRKGAYSQAVNKIQALGGVARTSPRPASPPPSAPGPAEASSPRRASAPASPPSRPAPRPVVPDAGGGRTYVKPPRDINMEGKYRTLARLCFGGKMIEAEAKAYEVLAAGYAGTRYECWIWDKLAGGYERIGDRKMAVESYRQVMVSSDPRKGSYSRAKDKILEFGGKLPE